MDTFSNHAESSNAEVVEREEATKSPPTTENENLKDKQIQIEDDQILIGDKMKIKFPKANDNEKSCLTINIFNIVN